MKKMLFIIMIAFPMLLQAQEVLRDTLIGTTGNDTVIYSWQLKRYYVDFDDNFMRWTGEVVINYRNPGQSWTRSFGTEYSINSNDSILYNGNYYTGLEIYNYIFETDERTILRNLNKELILNDPTRYYRK